MNKNSIFFLCALFFIGTSYFLYVQTPNNQLAHQDIDSKAYIYHAKLFAQENTLANSNQVPYYTLGYALFIGFIYKIFNHSMAMIIFLQILFALIAGWLIFITTQRFFNKEIALISVILCATNLGYLTFSQFILTEIILAFFLLLFFERFTLFLQTKAIAALVQSGLALGLSMIIKPAALLYFIIPLVFIIIIFVNQQVHLQKIASAIALFMLFFATPVLIHMSYNKYVFGSFHLSSLHEINTYFWFYPNVRSQNSGYSADYERRMLQKHARKENGMQEIKQQFLDDMKEEFGVFVYVWFKNVAKTFCGLFSTNLKVLLNPDIHGGDISFFKMEGSLWRKITSYITTGSHSWWLLLTAYFEAIMLPLRYFFCLIALLFLFFQKRFMLFYFFTSYIAYFSFITGHDGCARFRMMFEFSLIILTAAGIVISWKYLMHKPAPKASKRTS